MVIANIGHDGSHPNFKRADNAILFKYHMGFWRRGVPQDL